MKKQSNQEKVIIMLAAFVIFMAGVFAIYMEHGIARQAIISLSLLGLVGIALFMTIKRAKKK